MVARAKLFGSNKALLDTGPLVGMYNAKRYSELESILQELVERNPEAGQFWKILGVTQRSLGKEAILAMRKATELLPDDAEAFNNLGVTLCHTGRYQEAVSTLRRSVEICPDYLVGLNSLGLALYCHEQYGESIEINRKVLSIDPDNFDALNNLGISLTSIGELDEAVVSLRRALVINPSSVLAYTNLGNALQFLGEIDEAIVCFLQSLSLRPGDVNARANLGTLLHQKGDFGDALACYEIALSLRPNDATILYNRSFTLLALGRLSEGWIDYEQRPSRLEVRHLDTPFWFGEDLSSKSILIWGEQGIGDEIRLAGMFAEVIDRASRCVIECNAKLLPLFTRTFPQAQIVIKTYPPHPSTLNNIDYQCAAGSLARWLRPTVESFPERETYLIPDPGRVQYWRDRLAELGPGPKIGFSWRSMKNHGSRMLYYTTLDLWGPIFTLPGVDFVNLQYDQCDEELNAASKQFGVPLHEFPELDMLNDLDETAALIQALDLVISAPTAPSIMAAALGVPSWVIGYEQGWQMLGTSYMPWFPTMRHFFRQSGQSRSDIIADIAKLLEAALGLESSENALVSP